MISHIQKISTTILLLALIASGPAAAADWIYSTRDGDTLWDLCLQYTNKRGCWIELAKYNGVDNDRRIPIGTRIRIPVAWLKQQVVVGRALTVTGEVSYSQRNDHTFTPLQSGQELHLGALIETGEGSVLLEIGGRDRVQLRTGTVFELSGFSTNADDPPVAEMRLQSGSAEAKVEPSANSVSNSADDSDQSRFKITTPAAIAAVRGTQFRVISSQPQAPTMRAEVISGLLGVDADQGDVDVPAGFGVSAARGEAPGAPRQLLAAPRFAADYRRTYAPVQVAWAGDPLATAWQLDLYGAGTEAQLLASQHLTEPRYKLAALDEGCYTLAVRAIDADGFNGLENSAPLCIVARLTAPKLVPQSRKSKPGKPLLIQWSEVAQAQGYRVELALDPGFRQLISTHPVADHQLELPAPDVSTLYVRVKAYDQEGLGSPFSDGVEYQQSRHGWVGAVFAVVMLAIILL